ncbi:MAG: hypothetical protein AB1671_06210 [Thermodesulfobacteriota bacterium]|jgi:hypothetical protein
MSLGVLVMDAKCLSLVQAVLLLGAVLFPFPSHTHATVYSWRSEDGALILSNNIEDIPENRRETAKTFTTKLAGETRPTVTATPPPPSGEVSTADAYERGVERGLQAAERQLAAAGEMARSVLSAVPPAPPTRIIIQQSAPVVRYVAPGYGYPFYGFIGPYAPYFPHGLGYAYGFRRGRLVPHSHFFPGTRGRYRGLFFPHGHFSQNGFLFGHGFVIR